MLLFKNNHLKLLGTLCAVFVLAAAPANAEEIQLNCKFTSSEKLLEANAVNPRYETRKEDKEYLVFFNRQKGEASYINLSLKDIKIKAPLKIVYSSDSMITLIEAVNNSDNHFSISVFWKDGNKNEYPAIKFLHSWGAGISFYNPEIELGTCSSFAI